MFKKEPDYFHWGKTAIMVFKIVNPFAFQHPGTLLYFFTEMFDGLTHGPRFHPLYFWGYVFGLNSPWLVVPPILIYQSWKHLNLAQGLLDKETGFNPVKEFSKKHR